MGKLEWWGYPTVKKTLRMYNRLHIIGLPACVGQTARETLPRHSPRYAYASRGKKSVEINIRIKYPDMALKYSKIRICQTGSDMQTLIVAWRSIALVYTMNQTVTLGACVYCMLPLLLLSELELLHRSGPTAITSTQPRRLWIRCITVMCTAHRGVAVACDFRPTERDR